MTVTSTPAELENYAARAGREGRVADAAAAYLEASQNRGLSGFLPAQQGQVAADLLLSATWGARGAETAPPIILTLAGQGKFADGVQSAIRVAVATLPGAGRLAGQPVWRMQAGAQVMAGAGSMVAFTRQKWRVPAQTMAGAGSITATTTKISP